MIAFSFLQVLVHTLTLAHDHKHTCCAAHMLALVSQHTQYRDTQLCPDESIILSYYAASGAGENCTPHPSSVLYFLLKISRRINKSELWGCLSSRSGSASSDRQFGTLMEIRSRIGSEGQFDFECSLFDIPLHFI